MGTVKQKRTAEQIKVLLSEMVVLHLLDPRLHGLTITDVSLDRELQHADVYVNALAEEERQPEVMKALQHALPFLRRELAGRLSLRKVPQLHFHWDTTFQRAVQLEAIFDTLEIPPAQEAEEMPPTADEEQEDDA